MCFYLSLMIYKVEPHPVKRNSTNLVLTKSESCSGPVKWETLEDGKDGDRGGGLLKPHSLSHDQPNNAGCEMRLDKIKGWWFPSSQPVYHGTNNSNTWPVSPQISQCDAQQLWLMTSQYILYVPLDYGMFFQTTQAHNRPALQCKLSLLGRLTKTNNLRPCLCSETPPVLQLLCGACNFRNSALHMQGKD